ncbi:4Fe-4S binding protein [Leisingera sp. S232]|uniref:4Fe-4S binding protein n=1 Tax=Leisingera sp. S232 TaxID=3415132 RepID=UPI003C7A2D57
MTLLDAARRSSALPLMELCQAAHDRKLASGRPQTLALYEIEPPGLAETQSLHSDVVPVAVCCLDRIGHADLLHALACGFDVIYLQVCSASQAREHQRQEVELVRSLGGLGRIVLFDGAAGVDRRLAARLLPFPAVAPEVLAVGSRRDTARASAAALLPTSVGHAALPEQAPYGTVRLDNDLCNSCNSCVWVCPTDALSLTENAGALSFVESLCTQCGLCVSICPQRAMGLEPGMDLTAYAVLPSVLGKERKQAASGSAGPASGAAPDAGSEALQTYAAAAPLFSEHDLSSAPETRHTGRV